MPQERGTHDKSSGWQGSRGSSRDANASRHAGMGRGSEHSQGREETRSSQSGHDGNGGNGHRHRSPALNLTASALRGWGQFYDMQAATARLMLRAQVRAASAFGLPDYSRIFDVEDERARHLFSSATENLVNFVGQEEEILNEVPTQVFRLMEKQAIDATERLKCGLEELEQQATESVEELREMSRRQAEEFSQASESFAEAAQASMRESAEQYRAAMRPGSNGSQHLSQESDESGEEQDEDNERGHESGGGRAHRTSESRQAGERSSRSRKAA